MEQLKKNISLVVKIYVVGFLLDFFLSPQHDAEQSAFRALIMLAAAVVAFFLYKAWKELNMTKVLFYLHDMTKRVRRRESDITRG